MRCGCSVVGMEVKCGECGGAVWWVWRCSVVSVGVQ